MLITLELVSEIKEDLDAQPQDKDVKKVSIRLKKYYKNLSKDTKKEKVTRLF